MTDGEGEVVGGYFRAAVKAAPGFTGAWVNLAATLADAGKFAEAKDAADRALRLEPKDVKAAESSNQMAAAGTCRSAPGSLKLPGADVVRFIAVGW